MKKISLVIFLVVVAIAGFIYFQKTKTPQEEIGTKVEDSGRDHVEDIYGVDYSSNPPTSGPHFPLWAKGGVYSQLISDGYLIHSMEHGYVVIWYNCDKLSTSFKLIPEVLAHGDEEVKLADPQATILPLMHMEKPQVEGVTWITPQTQPQAEVQLPLSFQTPACETFVNELKPFLNSAQRVIIVPRTNVDKKLAITAWNRLLNLDTIDADKINLFIKTYHNKGPEQTME